MANRELKNLSKATKEALKGEIRWEEEQKKIAEREEKKKQLPRGIHYNEETKEYGFRLSILDGTGKHFDSERWGFKSAAAAKKEMETLRYEKKHLKDEDTNAYDYSKTFEDVYQHYLENRAAEKRPSTLRRQESLWEHHIKPEFGKKKLSAVSKADMYNYLLKLYTEGDDYSRYKQHETTGYSYAFVEGFLKFFWLIYGYAYDNNWVEPERYAKDFLNKTTKLSMPKKIEEDEDFDNIRIYSTEELKQIEDIMKTGSMYLPYLIALHGGLRISEVMGLRWTDIDWDTHKLAVRRQMLYDYNDKVFYLGPPKTKNGRRDIQISDTLYSALQQYKSDQVEFAKSKGYRATEIVYDRNGKDKDVPIQGGDFIHRKENGELLTINSVKYWTDKVRKETGIDFHFHALRHTNASILAANNIPLNALIEHLGHANANVALKYYVTTTEQVQDRIREILNSI